jgi:hypothetical protein
MSNLQKFNQTLEEIDKEVSKLKSSTGTLSKIEEILAEQKRILEVFNQNSMTLSQINAISLQQGDNLSNRLTGIEKSLLNNWDLISKQLQKELDKLELENNQFNKDLFKQLESSAEKLQRENKDFYKDLNGTIKIKLEDNKSEVKQLIENERSRIKEIFELEFAKNQREILRKIEDEHKKQADTANLNHKWLKNVLYVGGGLLLMMLLAILIKLW